MVERPIKKSERQQLAESSPDQNIETQSPESRPRLEKRAPKERSKDRGKGKGDRRKGDDVKPAVNPALMRGPRPVQPQPVVEEPIAEESTVEEPTVEESGEEATEATSEPETAAVQS